MTCFIFPAVLEQREGLGRGERERERQTEREGGEDVETTVAELSVLHVVSPLSV